MKKSLIITSLITIGLMTNSLAFASGSSTIFANQMLKIEQENQSGIVAQVLKLQPGGTRTEAPLFDVKDCHGSLSTLDGKIYGRCGFYETIYIPSSLDDIHKTFDNPYTSGTEYVIRRSGLVDDSAKVIVERVDKKMHFVDITTNTDGSNPEIRVEGPGL